jgi:hypothetical protein
VHRCPCGTLGIEITQLGGAVILRRELNAVPEGQVSALMLAGYTLYGADALGAESSSRFEGMIRVMRLATGIVSACAFAVSTAWAQDLTGKWTATAVSNNAAVTLDLKVAGNIVTGAILNPQSGPAEIMDGKVEGNRISFHVVRTANNASNKILWQGTIDGEEIHFSRSVEGAPGPAMERRVV